MARPLVTSSTAARTGLYSYIAAVTAAYKKGSQLGQSVVLTVQHIGADLVAVQLRFDVPVRYSRNKKEYHFSADPRCSPATKLPNLKAMLELPAERGGQVSRWRQLIWQHSQAACADGMQARGRAQLNAVCASSHQHARTVLRQ